MQGLTKRQEQTLDFIRSSIEDRGYPPTLREIGEHMGIRSTNGVNDHLRALERKGYLTREDMKSRALKLVEDQAPPPARRPSACWANWTKIRSIQREIRRISRREIGGGAPFAI